MLEIGTYQGKSAILMGYGLRDDEELVVCDLFGAVMDHADIPLNRRREYSGLEEGEFLANWDRFHTRRPTLEVCESSELDLGNGNSVSSTSTVATATSASRKISAWLRLTPPNAV